MKKVLITESQLRTMVRKMLIEETPLGSTPVGATGFAPQGQQNQTGQQKDQSVETGMFTALQRDTALLGRLKGLTNFNQADKLIQTLLSLTKIPQTQIKSGLATLGRMGVQTQAGK